MTCKKQNFPKNSADNGKNYNSDEQKIEKFGTSDLENLEIIIFLKNMKNI